MQTPIAQAAKSVKKQVFNALIVRKENGWLITVELDNGFHGKCQHVFNNKSEMLTWLEELEWYPDKLKNL